jgi:predicted SprT family Zn-dependent metalloprotease
MLFPFPQFAPKYDTISLFIRDIMDIMGQKFGKWTVLDFIGRDAKSNKIYKCKCDCGTEKEHRKYTLENGDTVQCKSCHMSELNAVDNLIGKRFGLWSVVGKEKNKERNEWFYLCICDCGTQKLISGNRLNNGQANKCPRCRVKTHGMSYTSTFKIWIGILRRCSNKNFKAYKYYGGRGITICNRWLKFENFLEDMGARPSGLQIDRINNNGNYEPGNCRWVTAAVNHSNRNVNTCKKEN